MGDLAKHFDPQVLEFFWNLFRVIGILLGLIGGLVIYTWRKLEKSIEGIIELININAANTASVHKSLAKDLQNTLERLSHLEGEHNIMHRRVGDKYEHNENYL